MSFEFAKKLVERARRRGAEQAEAWLETGRESSVKVRDGAIEDLTQATSKGIGLRVVAEGRLGFTYTSDFDPAKISGVVDRALQAAKAAAPDRLNRLPLRDDLTPRPKDDLQLFDPAVAELSDEWKLHTALAVERAAKAADPRIVTFDSVGVGDAVSEVCFVSSEGVSERFRSSAVHLYAAPVASESGQLQTAYWYDQKRFLAELESPESVGRRAAERAVRMLGARKVKTGLYPVIFDPWMAASFLGGLSEALMGDLVFKKASFLHGRLGERIAPESVTIWDDGRLARGLGTSPFDGEGVPTRRTLLVEAGRLASFLYDHATARKAKTASTGNASRGYSSLPSIGTTNLYLESGDRSFRELIGEVEQGLYVTAMLGHGADPVTGDFSRGANGLWIERGEFAFPVQEVTVAGSMLAMLQSLDGIGNDLEFRGSVAAPTIRFSELMVSGE